MPLCWSEINGNNISKKQGKMKREKKLSRGEVDVIEMVVFSAKNEKGPWRGEGDDDTGVVFSAKGEKES